MITDRKQLRALTLRVKSPILFAFIVFAIIRFSLAFTIPVFGDAGRYFIMAKMIASNPFLLLQHGLSYPPPLFLLVAAALYAFFSQFGSAVADFSLRLISPIFGSVTIPLTYFIAKRIFNDKKIALYSTLFLGLSPFHIIFSSVGYMEGFFIFLVTLCVVFLLRMEDNMSSRNAVYSGFVAGLACLSKQTGPFLILLFISYFLLFKRHLLKSHLSQFLLLILVTLLIASPWYVRNLYEFGNPLMAGPFQFLPQRAGIKSLDSIYIISVNPSGLSAPVSQTSLFFDLVSPYYEFWGIWGGDVSAVTNFLHSMKNMFGLNLTYLFAGYTIITFFLSFFFILGLIDALLNKKGVLLVTLVVILFSIFIIGAVGFWLIGKITLLQACWGYRTPLSPTVSVLVIFAGLGLKRSVNNIKRFGRYQPKFFFSLVFTCLILSVAATMAEAYVMHSYYGNLDQGANWVKANTPESAVVLTSRPLEVAYLTNRRVIYILELNFNSLDRQFLTKYNISCVFLTVYDPKQKLQPYLSSIKILEKEGIVKEVYRDANVMIFQVCLSGFEIE